MPTSTAQTIVRFQSKLIYKKKAPTDRIGGALVASDDRVR